MTYLSYLIAALLIIYIIKKFLPVKGVKHISVNELKAKLRNKNSQLIDVRTAGEFKGNHIQGFRNIPLNFLSQQTLSSVSKDKEVIVICQSGVRSQQAAKTLKKQGFNHVTNVKGGMNGWRER